MYAVKSAGRKCAPDSTATDWGHVAYRRSHSYVGSVLRAAWIEARRARGGKSALSDDGSEKRANPQASRGVAVVVVDTKHRWSAGGSALTNRMQRR